MDCSLIIFKSLTYVWDHRIKAWILSAVFWGSDGVCLNQGEMSILPKSRTSLLQGSKDLTTLLAEKKQMQFVGSFASSQGKINFFYLI